MTNFKQVWYSFSAEEKSNIMWYIFGIMMYKLGLEFFNGSITTLATDRFNSVNTFTKLGAAQGVNQAAQCVGAILIAPLVKAFPTRTVLSAAVAFFALMTTILLIVDAATGGSIKAAGQARPSYGNWDPNVIFIVWTIAGIAYGMVELIRRVIPADVVGGDVPKLRRMDATVHVLYEVAGTSGAFASSAAISRFGNNYSFLFTPIFFTGAAILWTRIGALRGISQNIEEEPGLAAVERDGKKPSRNYLKQIGVGAWLFVKSFYLGAFIVFRHRRFCWLFPGYAVALYLHRFLESSLAPAYARRVLGTSAWSQIIVGGSNFGELLGAVAVFVLSDYIPTPLPWLRLDALALNLVWVLPTFARQAVPGDVSWAWRVAGCFIPISFGWAAGDVSLAAYVQSSLTAMDFKSNDISALGAVMSFLYSSYIVLNAVFSTVLGRVIDRDFRSTGTIFKSLEQVGGIHFSVGCAVIFLSTFVPIGAFAFNPKVFNTAGLPKSPEDESSAEYMAGKDDIDRLKKDDSIEREKADHRV